MFGAFLETKNYNYAFTFTQGYSINTRKKNLLFFKVLLNSFKFINDQ